MKKLFVLLLSVFVVMNVFATTGTTEESVGDSEATLTLTLADQYKLAFIASPDITSEPKSEFTLKTTGNALTMSENGTYLQLDDTYNVFYFYYQAYTNLNNLEINISAPNSLTNVDDSSQTIQYTASFETIQNEWDGGTLSANSITSGSGTTSASAKIKKDSTTDGDDYIYMGLCKVTISSSVNLREKKPGKYSAKIYLTLTAN